MAQFIIPARNETQEMRYQMGYALADLAYETRPHRRPGCRPAQFLRPAHLRALPSGQAGQGRHRRAEPDRGGGRAVAGRLHPFPVHVRCVLPPFHGPALRLGRLQQPEREGPRRLCRSVHRQGGCHAPERQGIGHPPAHPQPHGDRAGLQRGDGAGPARGRRDAGAVLHPDRSLRGGGRRAVRRLSVPARQGRDRDRRGHRRRAGDAPAT